MVVEADPYFRDNHYVDPESQCQYDALVARVAVYDADLPDTSPAEFLQDCVRAGFSTWDERDRFSVPVAHQAHPAFTHHFRGLDRGMI